MRRSRSSSGAFCSLRVLSDRLLTSFDTRRELKQEKEDEADRKKRINLERREKEAEKKRLAEMAARVRTAAQSAR